MKAIMKPIKPETCANIMNNKQSILVIKNKKEAIAIQKLIDKYGYVDIYGYCSKNGGNLVYGTAYYGGNFIDEYGITRGYSKQEADKIFGLLNDKVLFKFRCYKMEKITIVADDYWTESYMRVEDLLEDSCLSYAELDNYLKFKKGYAIHISDLEIFDEPKEISEFKKPNTPSYEQTKPFAEIFSKPYTQEEYKKQCERFGFVLIKAPKNFCYVEVE